MKEMRIEQEYDIGNRWNTIFCTDEEVIFEFWVFEPLNDLELEVLKRVCRDTREIHRIKMQNYLLSREEER